MSSMVFADAIPASVAAATSRVGAKLPQTADDSALEQRLGRRLSLNKLLRPWRWSLRVVCNEEQKPEVRRSASVIQRRPSLLNVFGGAVLKPVDNNQQEDKSGPSVASEPSSTVTVSETETPSTPQITEVDASESCDANPVDELSPTSSEENEACAIRLARVVAAMTVERMPPRSARHSLPVVPEHRAVEPVAYPPIMETPHPREDNPSSAATSTPMPPARAAC
eukprot:m.259228 g.259228  ORF g.259228 m.259228 type:complete len:224 (+) comp22258_c0_seq1:99-770(+)